MAVKFAQQTARSPFRGVGARAPMTAIAGINTRVQGVPFQYEPRPKQQGSLRLFLDSADVRQWEKYQNGTLYGFTTNPAILLRDNAPGGMDYLKYLVTQAQNLQAQELQIQAWGDTKDELVDTGHRLLDETDAAFVTIKLPCTAAGLSAASELIAINPEIKITITGVYTAHQVLLAQAVGADYVAPYLGRMADKKMQHASGLMAEAEKRCLSYELAFDTVAKMQSIVHKSRSSLRVLVASIRSADQMAQLAAKGCDTFTFSPAVADELVAVPDTLEAAADFEAAAQKWLGAS